MKRLTEYMIDVMQHYADGGKVEWRPMNGVWCDCIEPIWNWVKCDYRKKPEPRMLQLWEVMHDGDMIARPEGYFPGHNWRKVGSPFIHPEDTDNGER